MLSSDVNAEVAEELRRLTGLCLATAKQLRRCISQKDTANHEVSPSLSKEKIWPVLMCRDVQGNLVGKARQALRLTIKNVWDYPEMQRRGIRAVTAERDAAQHELREIVLVSNTILPILAKQRLGM